MKRIKLAVLLSLFGLVGIYVSHSHQFSSKAENDQILEEIAKYKSWTKVSKEPIKVEFTIDGLSGGG
jgi:hypothetical protein